VLIETAGGAAGTLVAAALLWFVGRFLYSRLQARRVQFQFVTVSTTNDPGPGYGARFVRVQNTSATTIFSLRGNMSGLDSAGHPAKSRPVLFFNTPEPVPSIRLGERCDPPLFYAMQVDAGAEACSEAYGRNEVLTRFEYTFTDGRYTWTCVCLPPSRRSEPLAAFHPPVLLRGRLRRDPFWANWVLDPFWYRRR